MESLTENFFFIELCTFRIRFFILTNPDPGRISRIEFFIIFISLFKNLCYYARLPKARSEPASESGSLVLALYGSGSENTTKRIRPVCDPVLQ